nr:hypothetical protein CFP56_01110 [Quercus suber]
MRQILIVAVVQVQSIDLFLLVETDLSRTHVDEEEKAADNGQDLEEVVLREVLVRVMWVELTRQSEKAASHNG